MKHVLLVYCMQHICSSVHIRENCSKQFVVFFPFESMKNITAQRFSSNLFHWCAPRLTNKLIVSKLQFRINKCSVLPQSQFLILCFHLLFVIIMYNVSIFIEHPVQSRLHSITLLVSSFYLDLHFHGNDTTTSHAVITPPSPPFALTRYTFLWHGHRHFHYTNTTLLFL